MAQLRVAGRQPRGWEQVVARLHASDDARGFDQQMLELQCKIVDAEYGVLWHVRDDGQGVDIAAAWPDTLSLEGPRAEVLQAMRQSAQAVVTRGLSQVMALRSAQADADASMLYIFATIMRRGAKPAAVSTALADVRSSEMITSTAAARELAAGLYNAHAMRLRAEGESESARQIRQAMAVLAVTQEATRFRGACMNLANELARVLACDRVSVGWLRHGTIKLTAVSDADHVRRHTDQAQLLESAMAECLDQQQPVTYPVPAGAEPFLAEAVVFSHRSLSGEQGDRHVLSLPLRHRDELVGVVTLERGGRGFDGAAIERLQMTADVVGPQLRDRYDSDRWLVGHAWQSVRRAASYLVGARHVGWKLLGIVVVALLLYAAFGNWDYHVSGPFTLQSHERRTVSVLYEGRLDQVLVEPGDRVTEGQLLARLNAGELRLERIEVEGRVRETRIERNQARAEGKLADVAKLSARIDQLEARRALLDHRIETTSIRSPTDGVVLTGYWRDKVGRIVEQGEAMFEIAPLDDLIAVVRVGEADFHELASLMEQADQSVRGQVATRAEPERPFDVRITRVVPVARADQGVNAFEVWCALDDSAPWLRPGMEGRAQLDAGRRPIAWIASHRLIDAVRLWLWW